MLYTNRSINLISFSITIILCLILYFFFSNNNGVPLEKISNIVSTIETKNEDEKENQKKLPEELGNWYIEIPSINLIAPIAEGTDVDTLNTKVGHFEETSIENGNIGLAAHNRGYEFNYFKNLKNVKKDDRIIYTHENYKNEYIIEKIEIIENTDWSYLEKDLENKITLITCIENEPQYRRCVQAVSIEK